MGAVFVRSLNTLDVGEWRYLAHAQVEQVDGRDHVPVGNRHLDLDITKAPDRSCWCWAAPRNRCPG